MKSPAVALTVFLAVSAAVQAQQTIPPCSSDPLFHELDFWVGTWEVFESGKPAGTNRIEKVLDGCAVTEDWTDVEGWTGKSLFYAVAATKTWKQVWITPQALAPGGMKEKVLVARLPGGGVRFQGTIRRKNGATYLDRTTLTPLPNGDVRQLIEISTDDGKSWKSTFDANYVRKK